MSSAFQVYLNLSKHVRLWRVRQVTDNISCTVPSEFSSPAVYLKMPNLV